MTTRIAADIAPERTARGARGLRLGAIVLAVTFVHAAVLTSLGPPREPSGRGQVVVSSALTVRQVAWASMQQVEVAARGDAAAAVDVTAPAPSLPPVFTEPRDVAAAALTQPPALHVVASNARPAASSRDVPRRMADERRSAVAHAPTAVPTPARPAATQAAWPEPRPQPPRAESEAAGQPADAFEGEPGASAAEALLPEHLLRSLPTYAVRLPPSQRLHFRVSRGAAHGEGTLDWSLHEDGRYNAALRLRGEGMPGVDWTSEGDAAGESGVLPRRMVAHRKGRAVAAANFALDEQKVSFSGARVERPFVRGGQDRLTWMLQLAGVLEARAQPIRDDERIVLYVVGPRGAADLWQWRVAGRETLRLGSGQALGEGVNGVPAVKLVREAQRLYDTEIELWLDPADHHLPLKWRQQQRGVERAPLEWQRVHPERIDSERVPAS